MLKKMALISLGIVLVLTITGFTSTKNYDSYNLSGASKNWQIENAVLLTAGASQALDAGTLIYTGYKSLKVDYLELNVLELATNKKLLLSSDYYIDYPKTFKKQESFNICISPISFAKNNIAKNLAIEVTYSLADHDEMITEIIQLY